MSAMIKCPKCKADLLDDSCFCDQCGEKLMFCPQCGDGQPRRGKRCTRCGSLLTESRDAAPVQTTTQKPSEPDFTSIEGIMSAMGDFSGHNFAKATEPKQPQTGGTMRPQAQSGGTMRPGAQGGTMRPEAKPLSDEPSRLVMVDDPTKVAVFKSGAVIGRTNGDYVEVFGGCPYVSSTHARITLHSSGCWLYTDVGSTNGTKVGSTLLEPNKHYRLRKGQVLEIGLVKFRVE